MDRNIELYREITSRLAEEPEFGWAGGSKKNEKRPTSSSSYKTKRKKKRKAKRKAQRKSKSKRR